MILNIKQGIQNNFHVQFLSKSFGEITKKIQEEYY